MRARRRRGGERFAEVCVCAHCEVCWGLTALFCELNPASKPSDMEHITKREEGRMKDADRKMISNTALFIYLQKQVFEQTECDNSPSAAGRD